MSERVTTAHSIATAWEVLAQVTGHSQDTDNYGGEVTCR